MLRKLFIVLFSLLLLFIAYRFARAKGWLANEIFSQMEDKLPKTVSLPWQKDKDLELKQLDFKQKDLEKIGEDGLSQIKILTEKAKEAGTVTQSFVEEVVQEDTESEKNISEKAFEYGRYIYCQEVVKQYEASDSTKKN